jgi:hypothetical protein
MTTAAVARVTVRRAINRVGKVVEIGWPVFAKGKSPAPIRSKSIAPSTAPARPADVARACHRRKPVPTEKASPAVAPATP